MIDSTSLIFPALGPLYQILAPWAEALLRVIVGLALVPHGLRFTFGMFPNSGSRGLSLGALSAMLGVRTKRVDAWAWTIAGLFAGIGGLFMGNMVRLNPIVLTFLVIPALAAAVVGRLSSLTGTVLGGIAIGVAEALSALFPEVSRYGSAAAFVVAILAILWYQRAGIGLSRDNRHLE